MKNKTITITLIALLTLSSFGLLFTTLLTPAAAAAFSPVDLSTAGPYAMDATPEMLGAEEVALREYAAEVGSAIATGASPIGDPAGVGDDFTFEVADFVYGDYPETFRVVLEGVHCLILINKTAYDNFDPVTGEFVFDNPYGVWRDEDRISLSDLEYLLDEFDTNIYPTEAEIFGEVLPRGDEGTKVWILIHNIRDESFYDPAQTSYVAGYFSAGENALYNKNMFHIDTYQWQERVGPDGERPYLYEGVLAHEFEHMIHFDIDPDEPSWVDEGLADMAGYFCGYGHSESHVAYYMVYHWATPLTFWGSGLEDYGASYLFQLYLFEKYGGAEFTTALVQNPLNGIAGIEDTLAAFSYGISFEDLFDDWTIANYIDDTSENPLYGYDLLTVGSIDSWGYSIQYSLNDMFIGPPIEAPDGLYSSWLFGAPMPYTAHYYRFGGQPALATLVAGNAIAGTAAYSGSYHWYSDMVIWGWRSFYQTFSIPSEGTTELNFRTYFEIEGDWDYGYVEVMVHGGDGDPDEWYTLEVPGVTTSTLPFPQDSPNCDDNREPIAYEAAGRWHAFTGFSGAYIPITMDLTSFAGNDIDLYFTTWQDGAYTDQMMYVDDIEITNGVFLLDDVEGGEDGWTTTGWEVTTGLVPNNWQVTLIETLWAPSQRYPTKHNSGQSLLSETHMVMMDLGTIQEGEIVDIPATPLKSRRNQVLIISNRVDTILAADYWVQFTH